MKTLATIAGAFVAVAGAVAGLLPFIPSGDDAPGPEPKSTHEVVRFEPGIRLGAYAERYPASAPSSLTPQQGARIGGILHLNLKFDHFETQRCTLRWTMIDEANGAPVPSPEFVDHDAGTFTLDDAHEHFTPAIWIPAPGGPEKVRVILQLTSDEGPCGEEFRSDVLETG